MEDKEKFRLKCLNQQNRRLEMTKKDLEKDHQKLKNEYFRIKAENLQLQDQIGVLKDRLSQMEDLIQNAESFAAYRIEITPDNKAFSRLVFASPSFAEITGVDNLKSHEQLFETLHPDDQERFIKGQENALTSTKFDEVVRHFHPIKKQWRWVHYSSSSVPDNKGMVRFFNGIIKDVTKEKLLERELFKHREKLEDLVEKRTEELILANQNLSLEVKRRLKSEESLKIALNEKEVLLKEVHHRVKNNLQGIATLLDLQALHAKDEDILNAFHACRDRVRAMCMAHRQLYLSENLESISLEPYLKNLAEVLFRAYGGNEQGLSLKIHAPGIKVVMTRAIACGLIFNELLSNSLKYAFPGGIIGRIHCRAREDSFRRVELLFWDNGQGLPFDIDPQALKTVGLRLVHTLAEQQLQGKMEIVSKEKSAFRIIFTNAEKGLKNTDYYC